MALETFKDWLVEHGAILLDPTNEWEVVRFKTTAGIGVVYTNKNGRLKYTGEADAAYEAYRAKTNWQAVPIRRKNLKSKKERLAKRDGQKCFYHGEDMELNLLTIEHLLNKSQGGTDHDNNLCLACAPCNRTVGNWALTKKMQWRDAQINKHEAEIVKQTATNIYTIFEDRVEHLSTMGLLRTNSLKIELRHIIRAMGVEV